MHAYVLMTNHFHLLIKTKKANCAEFMRHFNISYTGWFNWRHQRCGNLYQGRYHAYVIDADNYLLEVSRYLHLNPVRVRKMVTEAGRERWLYAQSYRWSSLPGYLDETRRDRFVDNALLLSMAGGPSGYRQFIKDGLKCELENPLQRVTGGVILGDEEFTARVKKYIRRPAVREQPAYRELENSILEPAQALRVFIRVCGIDESVLRVRNRHGALRGMAAELLYRYCEITQGEIGRILGGIDYVAVNMMRKRLQVRLANDQKLSLRFNELDEKIKAEMYNVKI